MDLFGPAAGTPGAPRLHKASGRVGRALHGAGAEGGPRSASTVWSIMA